MRCVWCDSEYTFSGGEHVSLAAVMDQVRQFGCRLVEVTGGEPLAQPQCLDLISALCGEDYEVLVETGGYFSTENLDPRAKHHSGCEVSGVGRSRAKLLAQPGAVTSRQG